jgi:hypothetical protein
MCGIGKGIALEATFQQGGWLHLARAAVVPNILLKNNALNTKSAMRRIRLSRSLKL